MSLLGEIMSAKSADVALRKQNAPVALLEMSANFSEPCRSLREALNAEGSGVIAEIKRRSPSRGALNTTRSVLEIATGYSNAGASGISVLTDGPYFGGSNADLQKVRAAVDLPILRKDFILDEYQVVEAKSIGADVLLLIAAALEPARLQSLARLARTLGLETLLEVHNLAELKACLSVDISLIGVNSRNLSTLTIDPNLALELADSIPSGFTRVAESGIKDAAQVQRLREADYEGFLIGERFMATDDPAGACRDFIASLAVEA